MTSMPTKVELFNEKNYLSTLKLILYPRPNRFDDSSPRQELLMCMIEALAETNIIATNIEGYNSALHDWYIAQENEMEQRVAKNKEIIEDATYNLVKLKREFGQYRTYQMGIMLTDASGYPIIKGKPEIVTVNNILSNYITNKDSSQMKNIEKFNNLMSLIHENEYERFDVRYMVQQALNANLITHRDNRYIWHSKAANQDVYNLGTSFDKMVNFFYNEYITYNEDSDVTNWYKDLLQELQDANIWIE